MLRTTLEDMAPGVAECKSPLTQGGSSEQRLTVARLVTGIVLEAELYGKTARERAKLGAQLVLGTLDLAYPTPAMAARQVKVDPKLVHRALGHTARPPCPAEMSSYIARFGIARTERLIEQIKAVAVGVAA